jgi:hypothetical protein
MGIQYRRLSQEHITFAQKSLLQSQLESLTCVKHIRTYKSLRHEELVLKIHTKKLLDDLKQEIEILLRSLPEPTFPKDPEIIMAPEAKAHGPTLEDELDAIKAKLAKLQ